MDRHVRIVSGSRNGGPTELEAARTPTLDSLARRGICGLMDPITPGITPGSGPAHLSLFGYDPLRYQIGRGVLEALGIGFELGHLDVASRGNFCTVDHAGLVTDRRAGRISTAQSSRLVDLLSEIRLPGVEVLCGVDQVTSFSERACASGGLGRLCAAEVMPLALANALRLSRFGA